MIGKLINDFDALPEEKCNIKTFNKMFGNILKGDSNAKVEIRGMFTGGRREVLVNNVSHLLDIRDLAHRTTIKPQEPLEESSRPRVVYEYSLYKDGVFQTSAYNTKSLARMIGR